MRFKIVFAVICILGIASTRGVSNPVEIAAEVYVTARNTGQRLARSEDLHLDDSPQLTEREQCVFLDPGKRFQTVLGIGGALTDASAETFYKLPRDRQQEVIRAYFDPISGIGYSLGRTPINSCDFSSESYTYVTNGDRGLKSFDIARDLKYRIPFIKEALAAAGPDNLRLFVSPWSPPAWMKDNNDMLHGGKLKPDCYRPWAEYYARFIKAYEKNGVPIWGTTVQNEPMAVQTWESCVYTAEEERDFVKNYLGPILKQSGLGDKKIIIWDHNRSLMYHRAEVVLNDRDASRYVWGLGFHWYAGDNFENVQRVREAFPKTHLLLTEACLYPFDSTKLDEWKYGETYGRSMINDFNHGAEGWVDWNVLLDETGGPNHMSNFCYAPIIGDTRTGLLHYLSSYYYIGQFSKFVRPGARLIASSSTIDSLLAAAFSNPDGKLIAIVMNSSDAAQAFYLSIKGQAAKYVCPGHSIVTFVISQSTGGNVAVRGGRGVAFVRDHGQPL